MLYGYELVTLASRHRDLCDIDGFFCGGVLGMRPAGADASCTNQLGARRFPGGFSNPLVTRLLAGDVY